MRTENLNQQFTKNPRVNTDVVFRGSHPIPSHIGGTPKISGTGNIFSQHAIENSEEKILTLLPEFGENVIYFAHELVSAQKRIFCHIPVRISIFVKFRPASPRWLWGGEPLLSVL